MLSVTEAKTTILGAIAALPPRPVALADALDCVLADNLVSPLNLPAWDNSAVDGYAVCTSDLTGAGENSAVHLRVAAEVPAGTMPTARVEPQSCARIFTGAPIPPGADAVVMQEDTRPHHEGYIGVLESVEPGENIRRAGEDVATGAIVLREGAVLNAAQLGLAAAIGQTELSVHPRPRVGLLVTGSEVIDPGAPLQPGQIYNSNSPMLAALLQKTGAEVINLGIADDTRDDLNEKLDYGLAECDVVVTVGGVSVGAYDLVKDVLAELGCEQQFWQVAMKPGKPFLFGQRAGKLVFGLPGNPVSALVTFLVLVRPALLKLRGLANLDLAVVLAEATDDFVNRGDRVHFIRAKLEKRGGKTLVTPLPQQGSHMLSSVANADCLVEVPGVCTYTRGTQVTAQLIP